MSWVLALLLAAASFCAVFFALGRPRSGWEAVGAALLLGIAGYGLQASPGVPGAPKEPVENRKANAAAMVEARQALSANGQGGASEWMVIGDALARHGQYSDAAGVLLGAVEKQPKDADAWLALANALVGHADGQLTPAALLAFRNASAALPEHPGPPFFLGLALASSGRLQEARAVWVDLLRSTPADAPWRPDLEQKLGELDGLIARQSVPGMAR